MRLLVPVLLVAMVIATVGVFWASLAYFRAEELDRASARLTLYQSTVEAELQRFSHLTYVLARDPFVIETATGGPTPALDTRLGSFANRAEIDAIYLMDTTGLTISASNAQTPSSFLGQNYGFRPYFKDALNGKQGAFYGIGATTGIPGYFFAEAVTGDDGAYLGVIAIKIDLYALQDSWRQAGERVMLTNADGVVLLASVPEWRYRTLSPLSTEQRARIDGARQFGKEPLAPLDWTPLDDNNAVFGAERLLHLTSDKLPNDWSLHYFTTDDQARTNSLLVTGTLVLIAGAVFILFQVQRTRRIGTALRRSVDEEAALRAANERLAVEINERRTAEQRLQKTQAELERAGRLAALGQLASSVTHELGQPIAAMRNHLVAAEMQSGESSLSTKLHGLVERMEGITRQLKFFSRKGRDNLETVDLKEAMDSALELIAPGLEETQTQVLLDCTEAPVTLFANRLRIEQVMTNLLRNALDAMESDRAPTIEISIGADDEGVWFQVSDNGHGLGDKSLTELREPFATTRESGHGMGLGLTISAGIVDDHNGIMTAQNRPGGGAIFKAHFPRAQGLDAA